MSDRLSDEQREALAEVLRAHGIYGFNGSQVACRCSQRNWRYLLDWHGHVTDALAPLVVQMLADARAEADAEARLSEMQGKADSLTGQLIKAAAWDEGWEAAWSPMSMHNRGDGPNPYRAEASGREGEQ